MRPAVTRVQIAALLAVAQDYAFGQPPGCQLRAAVLGQRLAAAAGCDADECATTWWTSALRFLGCTGHAYEVALIYGDEIELRAKSLEIDVANPMELMRMIASHAGPSRSGLGRAPSVLAALVGGRKSAEFNFRTACQVADELAKRLGLDEAIRTSLATNFERWNGRGMPTGAKGTAIPRPMRIAQIAQEFEVLARLTGVNAAIQTILERSDRAYEPPLVDLLVTGAEGWWEAVEAADPWDGALAVAPPAAPLDDAETRDALLVLADFADLKSPWTAGHSRAVAALVAAASGRGSGRGADGVDVERAEAAALVHDLGRVAVSNLIWDKPGPLTRDERDRAETHALVTEQLLRRVPFTAALAGPAGSAHERIDGSGYHRRATGAQLDDVHRVIAAADCYQAMMSDRPYRAALSRDEAAEALRAMSAAGRLDAEAVERVLDAAGHRRAARAALPAGLTPREAEVIRLVALGLTTRQIAERLTISAKTADHHVQHIYTKLGVSTRGAAALFAIEHGILPSDG